MKNFSIYDNTTSENTGYTIWSGSQYNIYNFLGEYTSYGIVGNNNMIMIYDLNANYISYALLTGGNNQFYIYRNPDAQIESYCLYN